MPILRQLTCAAVLMILPFTSHAERTLLVLGDSLSAAYGIAQHEGWVALLERRLADGHAGWRVVNASISGETSAGGLKRLPALLDDHRPDALLIALGSNDGLQGKPPALLRRNLQRMVELGQSVDARVMVVGNHIPPNYGSQYVQRMFDTYRHVAEGTGSAYTPFLLEAVATDESLFQADRLHPTSEAQPMILDSVWPRVKALLAVEEP